MSDAHAEAEREWLARVAFVGEYTQEQREEMEHEDAEDPDEEEEKSPLPAEVEEALLREEEMLEGVPLPGVPGHEKARRETWLKIPRRARAAIRKMHREWGHMHPSVLKNLEDSEGTAGVP